MSAKSPDSRASFYRPSLRRALALRHVGSWFVLLLLWLCAWLPLWLGRALGAALGYLTLATNRKRREIARINLALCFPQLDNATRERLLRRHFVRSSQATIDHGFLVWRSRAYILSKSRLTGLENLQHHLGRRNIVLFMPHMVGCDAAGCVLCHHFSLFGIGKAQRDPVVDWVLYRARARFGAEFYERGQGLRPVMRTLREGRPLYYLADEDFGPEKSVFAPFYGIPTATLPTLGRIAHAADAVVVPVVTRMLPGGGGYEVVVQPVLEGFPTGDPVTDATRLNAAVEAGIALAPEQYLWTFKRFKTRPAGVPDPYPKKVKRGG
jgi:Kdo2-lipid IVA lauroyltransferase/acyltransferase